MSRVIYLLLSFYYYYLFSFLFFFGPPLTKICPKPKWHLPDPSHTPRFNWLLSQTHQQGPSLMHVFHYWNTTYQLLALTIYGPHALSMCMHGWPLAMHHAWELLQPHLSYADHLSLHLCRATPPHVPTCM